MLLPHRQNFYLLLFYYHFSYVLLYVLPMIFNNTSFISLHAEPQTALTIQSIFDARSSRSLDFFLEPSYSFSHLFTTFACRSFRNSSPLLPLSSRDSLAVFLALGIFSSRSCSNNVCNKKFRNGQGSNPRPLAPCADKYAHQNTTPHYVNLDKIRSVLFHCNKILLIGSDI